MTDQTKFRLVEVDGYRERELIEAPTLEQLAAVLGEKTGRAIADGGVADGD